MTSIDTDQLPNLGATSSSRTWWGRGKLRVKDIGAWDGIHIRQPIGAREGRYDRRFVKWCDERRLLCVRTVDLFWFFENCRGGFYATLSVSKLRRRWAKNMNLIRRLQTQVGYCGGAPQFRPLSRAEKEEFRKRWGLGPWKTYYRQRRAFFVEQLARYDGALGFWRRCGHQARESFLHCARYSNRQADAHPDYLVARRDGRGRVLDFGFVEVKGPRESLRLSQKRFFPELARCAGQKVWLARFPIRGNSINFGLFTATGEVRPCRALHLTSQSSTPDPDGTR
jgi:hypothetical protein